MEGDHERKKGIAVVEEPGKKNVTIEKETKFQEGQATRMPGWLGLKSIQFLTSRA